MANCITKEAIAEFFKRITPEKLAAMSDAVRQAEFEKAFGKDLGSKASALVDPVFTNILKKIKTTDLEQKVIYDTSVRIEKLFENFDITKGEWKDPKSEADYGATVREYKKYIDNIKTGELSVKGMMKQYSQEIKNLWKTDKYKATAKIIGDSISTLSKTMINAVSTWDNSWMGRQGAITLMKSPKTWMNMARNSMSDFYKTLKGEDPMDALMAKVYSHPDYINGNFKKAELSFGVEEEVPINILEKTPVIGKLFKAADVSFIDSAIRARMGLWDIMKKVDTKKGIELDSAGLRDRGKIINSITARGKTGTVLGNKLTQTLLWAPKMLKADWDILTGHTFGFGLETKRARIEAAKTITNVVLATAAITAIAQAMGAQVETDPRSTDFLRIKIGNTRINTPFARGIPQIVTLFSRLATQETKNSSGFITKLNSGEYGSRTLFDVGIDFLTNKTTPPVGAIISWAKGADFSGKKPTVGSTAFGFLPISVQNFVGLKDDSSTQAVFGAFSDLFGVSSNTYSSQGTDWGDSTGKALTEFKTKVGDTKFKQANDDFNVALQDWIKKAKTNPQYIKETPDRQQQLISNAKSDLQTKILARYGFRYKQAKSKPLPKIN